MLTKAQTTYKDKKPKPSMKNKPKITQHERDYLEWLQNFPNSCLICGTTENLEMHHVKNKSTDKKDHTKLIALCIEHHKGNKLSPHGTPTLWREKVPMKRQLIQAECLYEIYEEFLNEQE